MASNSRFAIAVHILSVLGYLESKSVERVTSDLIAKSVNTHPVIIRNLLKALKRAGLIECKEGKGGGICLAKKPSDLSLAEVYHAIDRSEVLAPHKNPPNHSCPVSVTIKDIFLEISDEVDSAITQVLKSKNLKSVIDQF
jgi:Rrf2 family protein